MIQPVLILRVGINWPSGGVLQAQPHMVDNCPSGGVVLLGEFAVPGILGDCSLGQPLLLPPVLKRVRWDCA